MISRNKHKTIVSAGVTDVLRIFSLPSLLSLSTAVTFSLPTATSATVKKEVKFVGRRLGRLCEYLPNITDKI